MPRDAQQDRFRSPLIDANEMPKSLFMITAIALSLPLAACDGPRGVLDGAASYASTTERAYRLGPGDKLKVTVFNEDSLSGEFQVGETGGVAFPLVGNVKAAGLSVPEFQDGLTARLRQGYVRNPRVAVEVTNYRPFNVFGEVRNSGQYPFRPGMSVQDAVAAAGGFTYRANTRTAYIRRVDGSGEQTVALDGPKIAVMPGDDIRVPERYF